jgi:hypothetical protein
MKKILLAALACVLTLAGLAASTSVLVDVSQNVQIQLVHQGQSVSSSLVNFSSEVYNTGSIPYSARARIFVYGNGSLMFSGWSQESPLMPGDKEILNIYWNAPTPGSYESKLRIYFGNEIIENANESFKVSDSPVSEDVFKVSGFRTYDDHVVFDLESSKDVSDVVIIPTQYMPGWIFEQKKIDLIKGGAIKPISVSYNPTVWQQSPLKIAVVAENGRYFSEKTVLMEKGSGATNLINSIIDRLKLLVL